MVHKANVPTHLIRRVVNIFGQSVHEYIIVLRKQHKCLHRYH